MYKNTIIIGLLFFILLSSSVAATYKIETYDYDGKFTREKVNYSLLSANITKSNEIQPMNSTNPNVVSLPSGSTSDNVQVWKNKDDLQVASMSTIGALNTAYSLVNGYVASVIYYPRTVTSNLILQLFDDAYEFIFRNTAGTEVASIDSSGNATFNSLEITDDVTFNGDLQVNGETTLHDDTLVESDLTVGQEDNQELFYIESNGTQTSIWAHDDVPMVIEKVKTLIYDDNPIGSTSNPGVGNAAIYWEDAAANFYFRNGDASTGALAHTSVDRSYSQDVRTNYLYDRTGGDGPIAPHGIYYGTDTGYFINGTGYGNLSALQLDSTLTVDGSSRFNDNVVHAAGTNIIFHDAATYGGFNTVADDGIHAYVGYGDGQTNRNFIFADAAYRTSDHDHDTLSVDPTVFIQGLENPDTDDTKWGSLSYSNVSDEFQVNTGEGSEGVKTLPTLTAHNDLVASADIKSGDLDNPLLFSIEVDGEYVLITSEGNLPFKFSGNNSVYFDSGASITSNSTCLILSSPDGSTESTVCNS